MTPFDKRSKGVARFARRGAAHAPGGYPLAINPGKTATFMWNPIVTGQACALGSVPVARL